jgi:hypothetical protein
MSPSAICPTYLPNRIRPASARTTIPAITATRRRTDAVVPHRYSLPVVRELPIPPADRPGDRTW